MNKIILTKDEFYNLVSEQFTTRFEYITVYEKQHKNSSYKGELIFQEKETQNFYSVNFLGDYVEGIDFENVNPVAKKVIKKQKTIYTYEAVGND